MAETKPEKEIKAQVVAKDERSTGILKAEQPSNEEIPSTAELVRGYAKWTDNNGKFHKVRIEGTNALRTPAHEQHELTVEDKNNLDQAAALKTPRRNNEKADEVLDLEVRNDEVHDELAGQGVAPAEKVDNK